MIPAKALEELARSPHYVTYMKNENGRANFVRVKDYSQAEYDKFIRARDAINDTVLQFMDLYEMVAIMYDNLTNAYNKRIEAVKNEKGISARDDLVEINAYFASLIANFAMYLGCVPRKISSKRRTVLNLHNEATNLEYDNSFAYRLFYSLRNYTLHDTPPITGIKGSSRLSKKTNKVEVDYGVYIEKSKLLLNEIVAKKLAEDFKTSPDIYPVIELANEALVSLKNIHWKTIRILLTTVVDEVTLIEELAALTPSNQPYITTFTYNQKTKAIDAKLELVPTSIIGIKRTASKYI
jgi:hypothetical protein